MDFIQGRDQRALSHENAVIVQTRGDKVLLKSVSGNMRSYELPISIFKSNGLEYGLEFLTPGTMVTLKNYPNDEIRGELKDVELYSGDINSEQEGLLTAKFIKGGQEYSISPIPTSHVVGYQTFINVRKVKVYILNGGSFKFVAIPPETYFEQFFRGEETPGFLPETPAQQKSFHTNISTPRNQLNPFDQQPVFNSAAFGNTRAKQGISDLRMLDPRDIPTPRIQETHDVSNLEEMIEYSSSLLKHFYKLIELQIKSRQTIQPGQPFTGDQLNKTVKKFSELISKFQLPNSKKIRNISKKHKKLADLLASDDSKVYFFNLCQLCKVNKTSITLGCGHSICNSDLSRHIMNTYTIQRLPEEKYLLLARCNLCDYNLTETELSKVLDTRQFGDLMQTVEIYKINEQRFIAANKNYCGVCCQLKYNQEFGYVKSCNCRVCRNCFINDTSGYCTLCSIPNHSQAYNPSFHGQLLASSSILPVQLRQSPSDNIRSDIQADHASNQGYNQQAFIQPIPDQHLKTSIVKDPLLPSQVLAKDPKPIYSQSNIPNIPDNSKPIQARPKMTAATPKQRSTISPPNRSGILEPTPAPKPEYIPDRAHKVSSLISLFSSKPDAADSKGPSLPKISTHNQASKVTAAYYAPSKIYSYDFIQPYIPAPSIIQKEERKVNCSICQNDFKLSEIVSLYNCEHKFCKEDLRQYTLASIENDQITKDGLKCPDLQCKNMIEDVIMENIFRDHEEEWTLYNKKVISKRLKITYCPKCNTPFDYINRIATCLYDGHQFCTLCYEDCHEGACDKNSLIQRTKEMMKVEKVAQCPGCMIPYFKERIDCDHVKCRDDACGVEFCFDCACVRSPTLAHGNHYHRPQCNWFRPSPHPDDYIPNKCPVCKTLGQICPRPKDLETKGIVTGL